MSDSHLAHVVFFALNDPAGAEALVEACHKYLSGHEGIVHFSAGTREPELNRPVNDTDFHVALHVVFASREAHDVYQTHPRHLQFIAENKDSWKQVRVFDSNVR